MFISTKPSLHIYGSTDKRLSFVLTAYVELLRCTSLVLLPLLVLHGLVTFQSVIRIFALLDNG